MKETIDDMDSKTIKLFPNKRENTEYRVGKNSKHQKQSIENEKSASLIQTLSKLWL